MQKIHKHFNNECPHFEAKIKASRADLQHVLSQHFKFIIIFFKKSLFFAVTLNDKICDVANLSWDTSNVAIYA